jgi:hypothetical protein
MWQSTGKTRVVSFFLFAILVFSSTAHAQNSAAPASTLPDDLKSVYKLAKLGTDSSGTRVVQPGTVLVVQKGGMLGVPAIMLVVPSANYKDGELHEPGGFSKAAAGQNTKLIDIGEKVYVIKIDVKLKDDKVAVTVIECDECNGAQQPSSYKSQVTFQFPKGYLANAGADQVQDMISQVLAPEQQQDQGQQQAQDQGQQQQPLDQGQGQMGDQQQAAPAPVQVGQSYAQVLKAMGMPKKIMNVGNGQVYVYQDYLVTFVGGRVTDVQQP